MGASVRANGNAEPLIQLLRIENIFTFMFGSLFVLLLF